MPKKKERKNGCSCKAGCPCHKSRTAQDLGRQYCEGGGEPENAALAKSGGSQWSQGVVQTRALQGTGVLHY